MDQRIRSGHIIRAVLFGAFGVFLFTCFAIGFVIWLFVADAAAIREAEEITHPVSIQYDEKTSFHIVDMRDVTERNTFGKDWVNVEKGHFALKLTYADENGNERTAIVTNDVHALRSVAGSRGRWNVDDVFGGEIIFGDESADYVLDVQNLGFSSDVLNIEDAKYASVEIPLCASTRYLYESVNE